MKAMMTEQLFLIYDKFQIFIWLPSTTKMLLRKIPSGTERMFAQCHRKNETKSYWHVKENIWTTTSWADKAFHPPLSKISGIFLKNSRSFQNLKFTYLQHSFFLKKERDGVRSNLRCRYEKNEREFANSSRANGLNKFRNLKFPKICEHQSRFSTAQNTRYQI